jgi:hypothetical protein
MPITTAKDQVSPLRNHSNLLFTKFVLHHMCKGILAISIRLYTWVFIRPITDITRTSLRSCSPTDALFPAEADNYDSMLEIHINHCTDILFQHISCGNNLNLVTRHWTEDQEYPFPDLWAFQFQRILDYVK